MIVISMFGLNNIVIKKQIKETMQKTGLGHKTRINIMVSTVEPCEGPGYAPYLKVETSKKCVDKLELVRSALERLEPGLDVL